MSENIIQYVTAARSGDTDAMAKLYSRTLKASYFLAEILSAEEEAAVDITQKAYARAFCSLDKLKRPEAFEIWMKQNVAAAYKEGRKFVFADAEAGKAESSSEFLSEEVFDDEKKSAMVIKAVSKLKPELRTAIILHYNNGMPVAALAKFLGVSESTANALLGKAREEIMSFAGIESAGAAAIGAMPVLTKIFQRAAASTSIDNSAVRDIFIYAIDAFEAAKPAMPATPAQEEPEAPAAEEVKEEVKEEAPAAPAMPDNVVSFKQKINEILDKESVSSAAEEPEAPAAEEEKEDEDGLDVPGFTATAPSEEAERAVEQFSSYEKKEPVKKQPKKKLPIKLPEKINPKLIGIVCAALVVIIVICVAVSKIGGNSDTPDVENGTSSAISANAAGYDWRAGGFAECAEIVYLDENCAYFKSASTEKYGLLDYQGNVILQPHYDGFSRCGSGRDYSNRGSYHSLVKIGDEFYEFTIANGAVTISETPHSPHTVEADSLGDTSYEERDRYFEGYAAARKDGKWGYVSEDRDKKVIDFEYDAVNDLQASEAAASDYCRPVTGGLIAVKKGSMMGIINLEGDTVVPFEYSNIMPGSDGVFIAQKGGTWGVILVGNAVTSFTGVSISIDPNVPDVTEEDTTAATRDSYTVVSENGANVRTDAGAEFDAIGSLDYGDTVVSYDVKVAESTGKKWIKIRYNGEYGWVAMSNLEEEGV